MDIVFQYLISSLFLLVASVFLVESGEVIAQRLGFGHIWLGSILIASATSFPELVTCVKSISIHSYDMCLSNIYGSILFNLFLLGWVFLFLCRTKFQHTDISSFIKMSLLTTFFVCLLVLNYFFASHTTVIGLSWSSFLIFLLYLVYVFLSFKTNRQDPTTKTEIKQHKSNIFLHTFIYILCLLIIFYMGSLCVKSVNIIVKRTGLEENFAGFLFLALATSLPEIITVIQSFRKQSLNLILGIVGGTNLFNIMIIVFSDFFLQTESLPSIISIQNIFTALISIFQILLVALLTWLALKKNFLSLKIASSIVILAYVSVVAVLFFLF